MQRTKPKLTTEKLEHWKEYRRDGWLYRGDDKPAVEWYNGRRDWYPQVRPNDQPGTIFANGNMMWYDRYGEAHRDNNLPAFVLTNGKRKWFIHGELVKTVMPDGTVYHFNRQNNTNDDRQFSDNEIVRYNLEAGDDMTCVITLENIGNNPFFQCETCKKKMIFDCLIEWSKVSYTCPHCRQDLRNVVKYRV